VKHAFLIPVLAASLWASAPVRADTLRCGSSLISPGAVQGYVQEKCGAPESATEVSEPIIARGLNGTTYVAGTATKQVWRYSRRPGEFPAVLTFEGGVLKTLEFEKERH
jgi:hypothetical protein